MYEPEPIIYQTNTTKKHKPKKQKQPTKSKQTHTENVLTPEEIQLINQRRQQQAQQLEQQKQYEQAQIQRQAQKYEQSQPEIIPQQQTPPQQEQKRFFGLFQTNQPTITPNKQTDKKSVIDDVKEYFGYDTLNPTIYKWFNAILIINMLIFVISALTLGAIYLINNKYIKLPDQINTLLTQSLPFYTAIITTIIALLILIMTFTIVATTLKRNNLIVIRKYRAGSGKISQTNLKGKSSILFDKKDPSSRVLISWAGAITDTTSGCKIIQISEGHPTNDNLNQQVSESEWDKDVSRLTKAKSVADLAEAELFNQGLLGLKWQDLVLIIIGIIAIITLIYLIAGSPDQIAKKTVESLMNGNIQKAVSEAITNSGLLGNPVPIK
ncbi:MAG: hypothetical protein WCI04_02475 [archaeon]